MDNINCNCQPSINTVDTRNEINVQTKKEPKAQCFPDKKRDRCDNDNIRGIDSSLLFFFLILVCIVCQSDCDISMDTLLWFFLLLVVLFNQCYI